MIPQQFDRFELAGKLFIWTKPQSPLLRNDEFGTELWMRSVGPRTALTDLIRDDRGNWFVVHQEDMFKGDKSHRIISEQQAATLLQKSGALIPAEAIVTNGNGKKTTRRRRRPTNPEPRPLTDLQNQAVQLYGELQGDFEKIGEKMGGISRQCARKHVKTGLAKLDRKILPKLKKKNVPVDERGQDTLSDFDPRMNPKMRTKK